MYSNIASGVLLFGLAAPMLPVPPDPPPNIMDVVIDDFINSAPDYFSVPSGTIPWGIPTMPTIDIDLDLADADFDEIVHSSEYDDNIADMTSNFGIIEDPVTGADTGIEEWIGTEGILPDATGAGDFDIEIDLISAYEDITAYETAAEMGDNLGSLFSWLGSLTELSGLLPEFAVIGFILLCVCWMILVTFFKFALQFIDMLFSVIVKLVELIPVAE